MFLFVTEIHLNRVTGDGMQYLRALKLLWRVGNPKSLNTSIFLQRGLFWE